MRLVWTELALRDLTAAAQFIAQDDRRAAARQVELVLAAAAGLPRFPQSGRPGRREGTRAYRVRGDAVEILRVLHGRQRWPDHL